VVQKLFSKAAILVVLLSLTQIGVLAQEKKVKDQAEYDLFTAVQKETDLNKKVQLLNTWKEKYPDSDFKVDRQQILVQTYQGLNQGENMYRAAKDMLAMEPQNTFALLMVNLLTESLNNTAPDRLDFGEKAARTFMASLDKTFDESKRPQDVTPEAWKKSRTDMEVIARKTLAFVAGARKDNESVERELMEILKIQPNNGNVSYSLGAALVAQRKPEKQVLALYHFARAAHYTGENALPEATRKQVQAYLEKVYVTYHGDKSGLPELIELAKKAPFPPKDFDIKSAQQIAIEEENRLKETNPQLAIWMGVKKELLGPNGPTYFEGTLKGAALPKFKGKVLTQTPALRPKEVTIDMSDDGTAEIKLRLDTPMATKAEPGTEIEFEGGIAAEFVPDPFMLTLDIEKAQVTGWPAASRTAPATKKGSGKKK
jgi:hypothetical protein